MTGKGFTPTVDQIANDTITQISSQYWAVSDNSTDTNLRPFDPVLIQDIYKNELLKTKFSLRRIMLLEFSQYLENYLWKNYQAGKATQEHILSIAIMINEKFRERVFAWTCFKSDESPANFSDFFSNILHLILNETLTIPEQTILVKFIDNCVNSLEFDLVRTQVQRICGLPMWTALSTNRRDFEFKKFPKLKKFWKAIEKKDKQLSDEDKKTVDFERRFLQNLIKKFLTYLGNFVVTDPESGELYDQNEYTLKIHYLERVLELLIDLEALLPTRRFFNTLLEDSNLLVHCQMSALYKNLENGSLVATKLDARLFKQLCTTLKFYTTFEIDDQTGEAKTEAECQEMHYDKLRLLQKGVFKYFREDLLAFSLTNIATIDQRDTLLKHLGSLTQDRLYSLAEYLHLVPSREADKENKQNPDMADYSKELLLELIIFHMERRSSQIDELNGLPLYPCEKVIWDENLVPNDYQQQSTNETCLALPKLGLQFLTLHDYLLRNFHLFRLEAAYELRQDIEEACVRLRPYYAFEDSEVRFGAWSRMAQGIETFNIIEVANANVGETCPSRVRADVTIDTEYMKNDCRAEWHSLRRHDIGFLVTLQPRNTKEQRYNSSESFLSQMGEVVVRGCEIEGLLNEEGKLINEEHYSNQEKQKFTGYKRTFRVLLDPNQYKSDSDLLNSDPSSPDIYANFNVFVRRNPKSSNFKAVLECIRDLMNTNFVVPDWLRDLLLGYGDPAAANYTKLKTSIPCLDFNDTFLSYEHLVASFPDHKVQLKDATGQPETTPQPPFRLTFDELQDGEAKKIQVQAYKRLNRGPYAKNQAKQNNIRFTPTQIETIKSGMQPGLTVVVGPPGTGKTDVAVQIISNIYHNFPEQKTLIVTHSNQALNQLFEKIMALDIDERHLLRLGHGEESLETEKDFSRYGRVNYVLATRLELLDEVDRLQRSFTGEHHETAAYSCESAIHFYLNIVQPKWEDYTTKIADLLRAAKAMSADTNNLITSVQTLFPFVQFFTDVPSLFTSSSFEADYEVTKGCMRYIRRIFKQLEEFRAFELIRNGADRAEYLLVKEAKIIAMTCTHAALKRKDLVKFSFQYDNILMEEAAQILEIETFIPLLLQNPDHNGHNRLKRWIMIGDHHQLPPVIKNMTFQKYSNMEQSLFTRFVKLGIPTIDLDAQGRCRASLCDLFKWRYNNLDSLKHVTDQSEFQLANPGLAFDYQLINVDDYNGQGETEPQPYFYQNLAEAEYVVALFMYMRLIGYPGEKISILTTYNGQKHLIRDVLRKRCANNPLIGNPKKISTVDKFQGQQNDYILLSLVKTKNIGHLRDVRRLVVAMSRARLGLYIFARTKLFRSCFELTPVFNMLLKRPQNLRLINDEQYPADKRMVNDVVDDYVEIVDMPQMAQFVFDFYQAKLNCWNKLQNVTREVREKKSVQDKNKENRERLERLNEEERVLREKLGKTIETFDSKYNRLNIDSVDSSSDDNDNDADDDNGDEKMVQEESKEDVADEVRVAENVEMKDDDDGDESKETKIDQDE